MMWDKRLDRGKAKEQNRFICKTAALKKGKFWLSCCRLRSRPCGPYHSTSPPLLLESTLSRNQATAELGNVWVTIRRPCQLCWRRLWLCVVRAIQSGSSFWWRFPTSPSGLLDRIPLTANHQIIHTTLTLTHTTTTTRFSQGRPTRWRLPAGGTGRSFPP